MYARTHERKSAARTATRRKFLNIVDLLAVLPFYVMLILKHAFGLTDENTPNLQVGHPPNRYLSPSSSVCCHVGLASKPWLALPH